MKLFSNLNDLTAGFYGSKTLCCSLFTKEK
jgi:hypothetical protein